jgi:hypothetical protein
MVQISHSSTKKEKKKLATSYRIIKPWNNFILGSIVNLWQVVRNNIQNNNTITKKF